MAVGKQTAAGEQRPRATESTPLLTTDVAGGALASETPPSPPPPSAVPLSDSSRPLQQLLDHGGSSGGPSRDVRGAQSLPSSPAKGWHTWSPFRERPLPSADGRTLGRGDAGDGVRGDGGRSRRRRPATDSSTSRRWGDSRHGGRGSLHTTILGAMARAESSGVRPSVSERYMVPVVEEEAEAAAAAARSLAAADDGGRAAGSPGADALSSGCSWPRLVRVAAENGSDSDVRVGGGGGVGGHSDGASVIVSGCAIGDADDTNSSDVDVEDATVCATVVDVGASIVERQFGVHELSALVASLRAPMPRSTAVRWIHVNGVCDGPGGAALLNTLSSVYGLHPLACEDVLMTPQRPKVEQYELVGAEESGILTTSDDNCEAGTSGADAAADELATDWVATSANGGAPWARIPLYSTADSDGSGIGGYSGGASLFVVCHSHELGGDESGYALISNQVSLFLLADACVVISFQESAGASPQSGAWLARVRAALTATVLSRGRGALPDAAHVVYLVMDAVVDQLFVLCEFFGFRVDELEGALLAECGAVVAGGAVDEESAGGRLAGVPADSNRGEGSSGSAVSAVAPSPPSSDETPATLLAAILRLRRDLLALRRTVWPLRDVLSKLLLLVPESGGGSSAAGRAVDSTASMGSDGVGSIGEASRAGASRRRDGSVRRGRDVRPFLRDVMDHTLQVVDILESYRSVVGGLMELYLGNANNRMQEIMKTLTVVVR